MPAKITVDLEAFKRLHTEGKIDREIGQVLGISRVTALRIRNSLGLPPNTFYIKFEIDPEEFERLHRSGMYDYEIAEVLGISKAAAWKIRNELELPPHLPWGRLPTIDLEELKRLHHAGLPDPEIAECMQCSLRTITNNKRLLGLASNKSSYNLKIRELYEAGLSDRQIARKLSSTKVNISAWRRYHKLPANDRDDAILDVAVAEQPEEPIQRDPESLFCDGEFLEQLLEKPVKKSN